MTQQSEAAETRKPYFLAAECVAGCKDDRCPYIHYSGWVCHGAPGIFSTPEEALSRAALKTGVAG